MKIKKRHNITTFDRAKGEARSMPGMGCQHKENASASSSSGMSLLHEVMTFGIAQGSCISPRIQSRNLITAGLLTFFSG